MTTLGIIAWGSFCIISVSGVFKQFNLPRNLFWAIVLVVSTYTGPVLFFWGNSSAVNIAYGMFLVIMLISLLISYSFKRTRKTFAWFFLGVVILFSVFWTYPAGLLPYRSNWEEMGEGMLEKYLGVPFHHSTLAPAITSIILLFHCWCPSSCVFKWFSKHLYVYALASGILIFAITSQIPEIFKYGTPWW